MEEQLEKYTLLQLRPKEEETSKVSNILYFNLFFSLLHVYFSVES